MQIPYRKDLLHSTIDYEKLIKLQAEEAQSKNDSEKLERAKFMIKSRGQRRIHRGGRK